MEENWKNIEGYDGLYQISNYGRVRNTDTGRILKQSANRGKDGYYKVILKKKTLYTHKLVAKYFIPVPKKLIGKKICVNHIDFNTLNNNVSNLEWVTFRYNSTYRKKSIERLKTEKAKYTFVKRIKIENE